VAVGSVSGSGKSSVLGYAQNLVIGLGSGGVSFVLEGSVDRKMIDGRQAPMA